jgi:hypothetical protein
MPTRCDRWIFIADLIVCSTCFGHHYAHHQELKSVIQVVAVCRIWCLVFKLSVQCGVEGCVSGLQAFYFHTIRLNTVMNVLNHWWRWVLLRGKGSNVTYFRALCSGTSPTGPRDDNRTGHTDVLRFPRDDFPILRFSPMKEVLLLLYYSPRSTLS